MKAMTYGPTLAGYLAASLFIMSSLDLDRLLLSSRLDETWSMLLLG
jgi:hypothetical protein